MNMKTQEELNAFKEEVDTLKKTRGVDGGSTDERFRKRSKS